MANRSKDWRNQAGHDLEHAREAVRDGHYDWACFAAHQTAEKSLKALFLRLGGEAWGHSVTMMLRDLKSKLAVPEDVEEAGARLDKHYILTRYPNGFDAGAPVDYYTLKEAEQAAEDARRIYDFCDKPVSG